MPNAARKTPVNAWVARASRSEFQGCLNIPGLTIVGIESTALSAQRQRVSCSDPISSSHDVHEGLAVLLFR